MLSAAQAQLAAAKLAQARAVPFAWLAGRNTSSVTRRRRPASPRRPLFVGSAGQVIAARGRPGEHMTLPASGVPGAGGALIELPNGTNCLYDAYLSRWERPW